MASPSLTTSTLGMAGVHGHPSHDFQERVMGLRLYRQQLIASNIANADTPGYKAVDVDIEDALRASDLGGAPLRLSVRSPAHMTGSETLATNAPLKYVVAQQASVDGNTVNLDVERAKFAQNALMYEFSLDRVSGHFKMMSELYRELE